MSRLGPIRNLVKNDFVRSASALVGGTAVAQALTILALPILTRLYSPDDFSILAVYIAILTMVQAVACLRLEIAIPLPEQDEEAANLFVLSVGLTLFLSCAAVLFIWGWGDWFFATVNQPTMQPYGWLLPIGLCFAGLYGAIQYWSSRKRRFGAIARTRMTQSGAGLAAQLGLGWAGAGSIGLLIGHAIMSGAGVLNLFMHAVRNDMPALRSISGHGMRRVLDIYRRFPLYSTWDALANNAALQVPVLLIAAYALGPEAGFLLLASRAVGTPVTMIGNAVGQVYLAKAPEHQRQGTLPEFTRSILFGLTKMSVAPLILLGLLAPWLVGPAFGTEWERVGVIIAWMIPWFVLKLLSSPISMVMHVRMQQALFLAVNTFGLAVRVGAVLVASSLAPELMVEVYAIAGAFYYLTLFCVISVVVGFSASVNIRLVGVTISSCLPILAILLEV